jgi:hypothetical protein
VTGMEKLLARIKALFEPSRPAEPSPEIEVAPPTPAVTPTAEERPPEPGVSVSKAPPAPMAPPVEEEVPAQAAEAPTIADQAPAEVEPTPAAAEVEPAPVTAAGVLALRLENERARSTYEVTKSGATIGRGPESTIQLADLSVSRKHAKIAYRQGAYWVSDLGSMGGTWVDGTKLAAPRRVTTGQTIDIGVCRLTVVSSGADEEPATAKATPHAASRR